MPHTTLVSARSSVWKLAWKASLFDVRNAWSRTLEFPWRSRGAARSCWRPSITALMLWLPRLRKAPRFLMMFRIQEPSRTLPTAPTSAAAPPLVLDLPRSLGAKPPRPAFSAMSFPGPELRRSVPPPVGLCSSTFRPLRQHLPRLPFAMAIIGVANALLAVSLLSLAS